MSSHSFYGLSINTRKIQYHLFSNNCYHDDINLYSCKRLQYKLIHLLPNRDFFILAVSPQLPNSGRKVGVFPLHVQLHGVVLFTKAEVLAQTSEGHWKPVLYWTLNTSVSYLPLLVITYFSTPSAFKVASDEVGWSVVIYNTKITILVKEQVASFVEPIFIINSRKQATTVSGYTLRLTFCSLSLHTTGIKGITLTASLFVYNPRHYLSAIPISPIISVCQCCIYFRDRDIPEAQLRHASYVGEVKK